MAARAKDGERWIGGRLFVLHTVVGQDKAMAQELADRLRRGECRDCACCPPGRKGEKHLARVVRYGWHDLSFDSGLDLNDYAVFTFPK